MTRSPWWLGCLLVMGCSKSAPSTADAGPVSCGVGDSCNLVMNTDCDADQRCDIVQINSHCWEPVCVAPGTGQNGAACANTNNEGGETWDNCSFGLVCYRGMCRVPCGDAGCAVGLTCTPDADVGTLVVSVCLP